MTRTLDADVTIAYVQELAKLWRREEARTHRTEAHRARAKAVVLEQLAKDLAGQAQQVKVA